MIKKTNWLCHQPKNRLWNWTQIQRAELVFKDHHSKQNRKQSGNEHLASLVVYDCTVHGYCVSNEWIRFSLQQRQTLRNSVKMVSLLPFLDLLGVWRNLAICNFWFQDGDNMATIKICSRIVCHTDQYNILVQTADMHHPWWRLQA